jgi:hypothetical protein
MIAELTKRLSFRFIKPTIPARRQLILDVLGNKQMTTRELAYAVHKYTRGKVSIDMNSVRPRVSEMVDAGILQECGTKKCRWTNKTVAIYERI